jgi:hypothetical protein
MSLFKIVHISKTKNRKDKKKKKTLSPPSWRKTIGGAGSKSSYAPTNAGAAHPGVPRSGLLGHGPT